MNFVMIGATQTLSSEVQIPFCRKIGLVGDRALVPSGRLAILTVTIWMMASSPFSTGSVPMLTRTARTKLRRGP